MINTLKIPSTPTFRLGRIVGFSAALLLTSATASFAAGIPKLNAADTLIDAQLQAKHNGVTLKVAKTTTVDSQFIADAAIDAINALQASSKVLPATIVTAALNRVPQFAASISEAALAKVYGTTVFPALNTPAKKNKQVSSIVSTAFSKGLATYKVGKLPNGNSFAGFGDKSDIATQITFKDVSALGNPATLIISTDPKLPSPLQVVVTAAVKAAIKVKSTDLEHNGVSGAVAGAIYETAGSNNSSIKDAVTANDAVVKAILKTAAKSASTHALEIAQAAGYAFATTYRQTHATLSGQAAEVGLPEFLASNVADIVAAINSGLSPANAKKFAAPSKTKGQNLGKDLETSVIDGITKAYATSDSAGGSGRRGVYFADGVAHAVTKIN
ncbi:MAG: hypothetical protein JWL59_1735 [Chthoniobacteraceae bacterium]|nr:hypothetical protein [Chthoniobacteraceae bacterium]